MVFRAIMKLKFYQNVNFLTPPPQKSFLGQNSLIFHLIFLKKEITLYQMRGSPKQFETSPYFAPFKAHLYNMQEADFANHFEARSIRIFWNECPPPGAECTPWQWKIWQKLGKKGKIGKKEGKRQKFTWENKKNLKKRKNREETYAKISKVLSLCPSWQIGLATLLPPPHPGIRGHTLVALVCKPLPGVLSNYDSFEHCNVNLHFFQVLFLTTDTQAQGGSQTLYTAQHNAVVSHGPKIWGLPVFADHPATHTKTNVSIILCAVQDFTILSSCSDRSRCR